MVKRNIVLGNVANVQEFNRICGHMDFDVDLAQGKYLVDAKSIMGIFSLDLSKPINLNIRPLIGFDKQEIVDVSEKIDTYETSIQPFEDCCTIFVAKHPVTKPNIDVIRRSEENLNEKIDELMKQAIETVEVIEVK